MRLFSEAEDQANGLSFADEESGTSIVVGEHRRKKSGRKATGGDAPREEVIHDLGEEEKRCRCCGKERPLLDDEITEEVEVVPARAKVLRHIRRVYGPCECKQFKASEQPPIVRAAVAARMIPGSIAAPGFLAYVVSAKVVDALPFYRQEKTLSRFGLEITRATLASWAIAVAARCGALIELMWELIREGPFQQMDETTVQVLHESNRAASAKSYVWVNLGYVEKRRKEQDSGDNETELKPIVLYHYHPSRAAEVITSALEGHEQGYLQSDGYEAYTAVLSKMVGTIHIGCLAHVGRKFYEAAKVTKKPGSSEQALAFIAKIYRVEKQQREQLENGAITRRQFVERRAEKARPVLEAFKAWLDERAEQVPP